VIDAADRPGDRVLRGHRLGARLACSQRASHARARTPAGFRPAVSLGVQAGGASAPVGSGGRRARLAPRSRVCPRAPPGPPGPMESAGGVRHAALGRDDGSLLPAQVPLLRVSLAGGVQYVPSLAPPPCGPRRLPAGPGARADGRGSHGGRRDLRALQRAHARHCGRDVLEQVSAAVGGPRKRTGWPVPGRRGDGGRRGDSGDGRQRRAPQSRDPGNPGFPGRDGCPCCSSLGTVAHHGAAVWVGRRSRDARSRAGHAHYPAAGAAPGRRRDLQDDGAERVPLAARNLVHASSPTVRSVRTGDRRLRVGPVRTRGGHGRRGAGGDWTRRSSPSVSLDSL
jgi:hypothetical protein